MLWPFSIPHQKAIRLQILGLPSLPPTDIRTFAVYRDLRNANIMKQFDIPYCQKGLKLRREITR